MDKLISVIITTYNRKKYLDEAIESVLGQTYKNIEIIIIDDFSTDGTYEWITKKYGDKIEIYRNTKNKGPGINRKLALEKYAKGDYVMFLDDDDLLINKSYFEKAINFFLKHPKLSMVSAPHIVYNTMDQSNTEILFPYHEDIVNGKEFFLRFDSKEYKKPIASVTIFSMEALKFSNYQEMKILNDTTIFLRALLYGDMGFIQEYSARYLVHGNNISFHCDIDFILDNLNEKYKIYRSIKKRKLFSKEVIKKWFFEQSRITIEYYIKGSKPSRKEIAKILFWVFIHRKKISEVKMYDAIYKGNLTKEKFI